MPQTRSFRKNAKRSLFRGKTKSRWCPFVDGVSYSSLSMFRSCREQTRLYRVEGWRVRDSLATRQGMNFGNCVHAVLEKAYAKKTPPSDKTLSRWIATYEHGVLADETRRQGNVVQSSRDKLAFVCGLAEVTLPTYFERFRGDWPGEKYPHGCKPTIARPVKWPALEETFRVKLTLPNGKAVPVIGKRDGRFVDSCGDTWILDTKCLAVIDEQTMIDTLGHNLQQMIYLWAYWKEFDRVPAGCVLNVIRRSSAYRRKDEPLKDYLSRVRDEISKRDNWYHYFKRIPHSLSGSRQLEQWEQRVLIPLVTELCQWWAGDSPHYMNDDALVTKYGRAELYEPIVFGNFSRHRQLRTRAYIPDLG